MSRVDQSRLARNTAFLYMRMLVTIFVSLYTSRIVLETLGVDNYGIYNIVGGIVMIFTFLNGTMTGATQRFLNFEMGKGCRQRLRSTFSSAVAIHAGLALVLIVAGETVGLWFVNHELVIAPERMYAANWAYQLSLVACVITIVQVPFNAAVIAHEQMDIFAYISLVNTFLRLGVVLMLAFVGSADTLIVYAWLMLGVSVTTFLCYFIYCRKKYKECRLAGGYDHAIVKSMIKFSTSDIFGNLCYTLNYQGVLVILNRYGGTALNAAGGLTLTVAGALTQFGAAILSAFRPQIVKQYAIGDYDQMQRLMVNCSRFSILLLGLIGIPALIFMPYLLDIWLKDVPAYTADFCRLALIAAAGELAFSTIKAGIHATGRILKMSAVTGAIYLVELPVMWFAMVWSCHPQAVYVVHITLLLVQISAVLLIIRAQLPSFSIIAFVGRGLALPLVICVCGILAAGAVRCWLPEDFLSLILCGLVSLSVVGALTWLSLDKDTRGMLCRVLHEKFRIAGR